MKRTLVYLFLVLSVALIFVLGYKYIYQDHRTIEDETAFITTTTFNLEDKFKANPVVSPDVLNKTIVVTGVITEIEEQAILLDEKVHCTLNEMVSAELKLDSFVKVKGRCIGYDELFEIVKMDQCMLIE